MEQLSIGICEDNKEECMKLLNYLGESDIEKELDVAESAEDFLQSFYPGKYDLLFMDIYLKGMTGIEALKKIRAADEQVEVAIMTTSQDFALEAYRLRAVRYLEKPLKREDIFEFLSFVLQKKEAAPHFVVESGGRQYRIPFERIAYLEQSSRKITIHQTDGEPIVVNGRLDLVEEQFPKEGFFRCHKSYLVNLSKVQSVDKELMTFVMEDGQQVHIRRQSFYPAKKAFEDYLFSITKGWRT